MTFKTMTLTAAFLSAMIFITPGSSMAQDSDGFLMTDTEKKAIQEVVKEYIKNNPEVLVDVLNDEAARVAEAKRDEDNKRLTSIPEGLYDYPLSPKIGSKDGSVKVVEFFDYNCGFCKRVISDVNRVIDEDSDVTFIFKELPILSDASEVAARYALASESQGKYFEFHTALMENRGRLDEARIIEVAEQVGLDIEQLKKDANSQDISDALQKNREFAQELGVRGTPFFLIGKQKIPGAVGFTRMKSVIEQERSANEG